MINWRIEKRRLARYLHLPLSTPLKELQKVKKSLDETYKEIKKRIEYAQFMQIQGIKILR